MRQAKRRAVLGGCLLTGAVLLGLVGCSAGPLIGDRLPEAAGGLPAGAPARPATPYQFPAVHDMPPPRDTKPLSDEDQAKLEKELQATRDRQAAQAGADAAAQDEQPAPEKKPAAGAKTSKTKQNTGAKNGVNTGAKANP